MSVKYTLRFVSHYWYFQHVAIQISTCTGSLNRNKREINDSELNTTGFQLFIYFRRQFVFSHRRWSVGRWQVLRHSRLPCLRHKLQALWGPLSRHHHRLIRKAAQWGHRSTTLTVQRKRIKVVRQFHLVVRLCLSHLSNLHRNSRTIHLIHSKCNRTWVHRLVKYIKCSFCSHPNDSNIYINSVLD